MAKTIKSSPAKTIDEYIASFPAETQRLLEAVRSTIKKAAPKAEEAIKYDIPTFTFKGNLVSFGAWKKHIGLYPVPREVAEFKAALSVYKGAKSTAQFPLNEPLPVALIASIVKYRVQQMVTKEVAKIQQKPATNKA